jgi:hypothetical protein
MCLWLVASGVTDILIRTYAGSGKKQPRKRKRTSAAPSSSSSSSSSSLSSNTHTAVATVPPSGLQAQSVSLPSPSSLDGRVYVLPVGELEIHCITRNGGLPYCSVCQVDKEVL